MKNSLISAATWSIAALLSAASAQAQESTPKSCFVFSNKSEKVLVGYKEMHWFKQCPMDVVIPDSALEGNCLD